MSSNKQPGWSIPDHPAALLPVFDHESPNEPISLHAGEFFLTDESKRARCEGDFSFEWFPTPRVRFSGEGEAVVADLFDLDSVTLKIPALSASASAFLAHLQFSSDQVAYPIAGFLSEPTWIGGDGSFDELRFHLPNFHQYIGDPIQTGGFEGEPFSGWLGRLPLEGPEWRVYLDQYSDYSDRRSEVRREGGYVLGHVGKVERVDGGSIDQERADDILFALHIFFSFCRSSWCSPTLAVMGDPGQGGPVRLRSPILSAWSDESSWFPTHETGDIGQVFSGFMSRWRDALWRETLIHTTHWYVESNQNAGMLEGAITLAQTALEHLSWVYLVEQEGLFSANHFEEKMGAAEKFRTLFSELDVPTAVPKDSILQSTVGLLQGEGLQFDDGPDLFVKVRNMIVHPKRVKRERLSLLSSKQKWKIKQLGLRYIELLVLRLLGYSGPYHNRLERGSIEKRRSLTPW